ncbi:hypothetical protein EKO23_01895 [Nocardioides guangzhouensis]|uniref:Uncharacterized protein n=1 Tax=Nocardioides guangzhouensis TaxID=2497878 RepID=A0A4Q4ZJY4_9ACTN|nr:hypothetical protein [Nocardioides guangzhouensis]RYP88667.1 hypothetical protein EKO23_01895 [Nocardioides guangzhouensis]
MKLSLDHGVRLGVGVDTVLQLAKGEAIEYAGVTDAEGGQTVTAEFRVITTQQELSESLDLSVSASVRYGLANVDGRMDFAEKNAINESSVYMMLSAHASNPPRYMQKPKLRGAAEVMYRNNPEEFRQSFGDCFVDEVYTGGSLAILFMFHTRDESSSRTVSAELNGAVGGLIAGGEISGSFTSVVQSAQSKSDLRISAFISGGRGVVIPANPEEAISLFKSFPAAVLNAGVPHQVTAKPWREFPLPPAPTDAEMMVRRHTIETCGQNVLKAIQAKTRLQYILDNPQQFVNPDLLALTTMRQQLHGTMTKWAQAAHACNQDIKQCTLEGLEFPVINWPDRVESLDPLGDKIAQVELHDSRARAWLRALFGLPLDMEYDRDEGREGSRWRFANDGDGKQIGGVFYTPETGAHVVYGGIFRKYAELGGCTGKLGFPITDEENFDPSRWPGHDLDRCQRFEHGFVWWDAQTQVVSDGVPLDALTGMRESATGRLGRVRLPGQ